MSVPSTRPQVLDFFGRPLVIQPSPEQLSSDAGLLSVRQFDEHLGLAGAFVGALTARCCAFPNGDKGAVCL